MSRLSPITRVNLPPDQQKGHDELTEIANNTFGNKFTWKREDGAMLGPFPAFVAAPEAGIGMLQCLGKISKIPGLSPEAKETAILTTGAHYKAAYELYAHTNVAVKTTKLSKEQVKEIAVGKKPAGLDEACDVAYDVANYLSRTPGPLEQRLWDRATKVLGKEGTIALVHYVGMYAYTCMVLNAMDAPVPKDDE